MIKELNSSKLDVIQFELIKSFDGVMVKKLSEELKFLIVKLGLSDFQLKEKGCSLLLIKFTKFLVVEDTLL